MKIYILDHDYPNAVPEDGSEGDIDGFTRFVRLQDHQAQVAGRDGAAMALIDEAYARIAELEAAIDKLAQCKGRFHTEANFKALIAVREKNLHK